MFCSNCGKALREQDTYCGSCGFKAPTNTVNQPPHPVSQQVLNNSKAAPVVKQGPTRLSVTALIGFLIVLLTPPGGNSQPEAIGSIVLIFVGLTLCVIALARIPTHPAKGKTIAILGIIVFIFKILLLVVAMIALRDARETLSAGL